MKKWKQKETWPNKDENGKRSYHGFGHAMLLPAWILMVLLIRCSA